jgi:hypothetical protein
MNNIANLQPVAEGDLLTEYFCVVDPSGVIVHPTISLTKQEAIDQWIEQERACNFIVNAGRAARNEAPKCSPSWEQFEAQGFKCLPVRLEVINANNP